MLLMKVMLGAASATLMAGAYVVHEGAIRVSVDENRNSPSGTHVHLILPAALVPSALHFVPTRHLRGALEHARPWMPAAEVACEELARLPDTDLVEVQDNREHVQVRTRSGRLVIDVEGPDEDVHVSFPLRTAWKVAKEIEERGPIS